MNAALTLALVAAAYVAGRWHERRRLRRLLVARLTGAPRVLLILRDPDLPYDRAVSPVGAAERILRDAREGGL